LIDHFGISSSGGIPSDARSRNCRAAILRERNISDGCDNTLSGATSVGF
jgi:hypothetical protein